MEAKMQQISPVYPIQTQIPVQPKCQPGLVPYSPYQPGPVVAPTHQTAAAEVMAAYNQGMMLNVKKLPNGNFHVAMAQPKIYDGTEYEITKEGSLIKYSGWTRPEVVKDGCDMLKNAYKQLDSINNVMDMSYNQAMAHIQSGKPIY